MQTYRSSILPIVAIALAIFGISYSLTHNNEAVAKTPSGSSVLVQEVARFEKDLAELNLVHENHIKSYSDEMGCVKDSKALEIVSHHKSLLEHNKQRLEYHKLQLVQADTTNAERNQGELAELQKDFDQLNKDKEEIRTGFDNFVPGTAHITK